MSARLVAFVLVLSGGVVWTAQYRPAHAVTEIGGARRMPLAEARLVIAALGDAAPPELRRRAEDLTEEEWTAWTKQRDAAIRSRVASGDEDSVVNLMLYGTGFTRRPRATPDAIAAAPGQPGLEEVMAGRLQDLAVAVESPAGDERLQFARDVIARHGIDVAPGSRDATRRYLAALRSRVLADNERYLRRLTPPPAATAAERRAASATLYRDRGLSSDTTLRIDFAIEQAIAAVRDRGELTTGRVRRVAVVGPGLDFVDKAQGADFYAVQTIQPFAIADSLLRLGMAEHPSVTAVDISPRVLAHLRAARQRALRGEPYQLHVVLERDRQGLQTDSALVEYWRRVGSHVGGEVPIAIPAAHAGRIRGRGVAIRPQAVLDVSALPLNIVVERLDPAQSFELVIATNVLVYYEPFEQALAARNMSGMLRAGGLLLTNQPVPVPVALGLSPVLVIAVAFDRVETGAGWHDRGDSIYVYRKV